MIAVYEILQNLQSSYRSHRTYVNLSIEYFDNPDNNEINESSRVIKVTEPSGIQSWAGFYFVLVEKLIFPQGKEAISFQFYSPGPGHIVLLKLEDQLTNDAFGKKVVENKTYVHTQYLDDKEKVEAVAKLFSGEGNIDQGINSKENFIICKNLRQRL